jgi:hypothetical protein
LAPSRAAALRLRRACARCCRKRERSETGRAPGFLATIRWILMLQIREYKLHPRPMRGLATHREVWRAYEHCIHDCF